MRKYGTHLNIKRKKPRNMYQIASPSKKHIRDTLSGEVESENIGSISDHHGPSKPKRSKPSSAFFETNEPGI